MTRSPATDQSRPVSRAGEHSSPNRAAVPASGFSAVDIARVCHEANRTLQVLLGKDSVSPHWTEAPAWQTQSAVEGVLAALNGAAPEQLHNAWVDAKLDAGWRFGSVKDAAAMTQPKCRVPPAAPVPGSPGSRSK